MLAKFCHKHLHNSWPTSSKAVNSARIQREVTRHPRNRSNFLPQPKMPWGHNRKMCAMIRGKSKVGELETLLRQLKFRTTSRLNCPRTGWLFWWRTIEDGRCALNSSSSVASTAVWRHHVRWSCDVIQPHLGRHANELTSSAARENKSSQLWRFLTVSTFTNTSTVRHRACHRHFHTVSYLAWWMRLIQV